MRLLCARSAFVLALLVSAAFARAQSAADIAGERQARQQQLQQFEMDNRLLANPAIPPTQRALIDYGGYFSPQYFSITDQNRDNHVLNEYDLVGYLRANFDGANEVFLRLRAQYNDWGAGDSFDGFGSRLINPDFDRAYYKFDSRAYDAAVNGKQTNSGYTIEAGRDLIYWGNGMTIAEVVDGIMPTLTLNKLSVSGVVGVTPTRTVDITPDRPEFLYNTRRGFFGAIATYDAGNHHPFLYGLVQRDYNDKNTNSVDGIATKYSYNSDYIGVGSTGSLSDHFRYGIEGVYETGNTLATSAMVSGFVLVPITQVRNQISAFAVDAKLAYLPQDVHNSRVEIEAIMTSGDHNRGQTNTTFNGSKPNTTDRAFNGFGLVNTGLAFSAPPSNLSVVRIGGSTFPCPHERRLQVGGDFLMFMKTSVDAPIDEPTNNNNPFLGCEPDIYVNWEIFSDVTLAARYGVFLPTPGVFSNDSARQFIYVGATFAF